MDQSNPLTHNLLYRLSLYVPTQGEQRVRRPLEDFCTETLAYCLTYSPDFCRAFLKTILGSTSPEVTKLSNCECEISTQKTIEDPLAGKIRRADLIISFSKKSGKSTKLGIEVKLKAADGDGQIRDLSNTFEHAFLLAPIQRFPELRSKCIFADGKRVKLISWENVQRLLDRISSVNENHSSDTPIKPDLLQQFSQFLAAKGLGHISMKHHPKNSKSLSDSIELLAEWRNLFQKLALDGFKPSNLNEPVFEERSEKNSKQFFGCYRIPKGNFIRYAGFQIEGSVVSCYYEEEFKSPHRKENQTLDSPSERGVTITPSAAKGRTNLNVTKPYPNQSDSEQGSKLLEIFSELQKKCREEAGNRGLRLLPE